MIQNHTQFIVTLRKLGSLLEGLEELQRTVLAKNPSLYAVSAESVMEDIRRLREELYEYSTGLKAAS
jgi:hypothetical protein